MTLIMITLITLLVLTSMQHILWYYQAINQRHLLHQNFYQLEKIALHLAHTPLVAADAKCVLHHDEANQALQQVRAKAGCSFIQNGANYHYLIEDLGNFPCLVVYQNGQKRSTYHRRISVMQLDNGHLVQIRFITPGAGAECLTLEHPISLGLSSWRYLGV